MESVARRPYTQYAGLVLCVLGGAAAKRHSRFGILLLCGGGYCFLCCGTQDHKGRRTPRRAGKKGAKKNGMRGPCVRAPREGKGWLFSLFSMLRKKPHDAEKLSPPNLVFAMESIIPEKSETRAPCLLIVPTVFVNQLSWRIWIADERPGNRENTRLQKQTRVQKCRCLQQQRPRLCFWAPFSPSWPRALRCPWLMLQVVPFLVMTGAGVCHGYSRARGEIRRPCEDHRRLTHVATPRPPIKNESVGIEDDQIPS